MLGVTEETVKSLMTKRSSIKHIVKSSPVHLQQNSVIISEPCYHQIKVGDCPKLFRSGENPPARLPPVLGPEINRARRTSFPFCALIRISYGWGSSMGCAHCCCSRWVESAACAAELGFLPHRNSPEFQPLLVKSRGVFPLQCSLSYGEEVGSLNRWLDVLLTWWCPLWAWILRWLAALGAF